MPSLSPLSSPGYTYTWSYENRVSKHFLQFPLFNSLFTVLFAYVVFFFLLVLWLGICVEVDVDRIAMLSPPPLHNTNDSYLNSVRA